MQENPEEIFNEYYYQIGCGRPYQRDQFWLDAFGNITQKIILELNPKTVLDAGCALGFLVEGMRSRGVEAFGVDISSFAIQNVHESIRPYCWVGSITDPFPQKYDLIVTIEVLEHMPKEKADLAIANLCQHTNDILFCSGYQDFRETSHINLHPPEYWASKFAQNYFFRDVDFDGSFLTPWTVLFRRKEEPLHRIIMDYERHIDHLIQENFAVRQVNIESRNLLGNKEQEIVSLKDSILKNETTINLLTRKLEAIQASRLFRMAKKLRSLIPSGGSRDHWS
jgi:SAM-dependent methyltransferase